MMAGPCSDVSTPSGAFAAIVGRAPPWAFCGTGTTGAQGTNQGIGQSIIPGGAASNSVTGTPGLQSKFAQTSSYFRLTSVVSIGSTEINLYSLLYQDSQAQMVRPIQRSFTPD